MSFASASAFDQVKHVMEKVYGSAHGDISSWQPKPYAEGKGRYLWTDAFGVCNFINLYYESKGDPIYLQQANVLVETVHNVLGRDRKGLKRLGNATEESPLLGGLRIGKVHEESHRDGDGQYFHYLTKWMFALHQMSVATQDITFHRWAVELAQVACRAFVRNSDSAQPRMCWKMRIDLSAPAVPSEGNLDPFDGYITYRILQQQHLRFRERRVPSASSSSSSSASSSSSSSSSDSGFSRNDALLQELDPLGEEIGIFQKMVMNKYKRYTSDDPLDLGEALWISHWFPHEIWAQTITERSLRALELMWEHGYFDQPLYYRLAFREFGTTIGLQVCEMCKGHPQWPQRCQQLNEHWKDYIYDRDSDITPVMYCSSILPGVWARSFDKKEE